MLRAVLFDLYRTLIDIRTDEQDPAVYAALARFLSYRAVTIEPERLKDRLFSEINRNMRASSEDFPEIDILGIFREIMTSNGKRFSHDTIIDVCTMFRALTMRRFILFPGLPWVLQGLRDRYRLGLVSDAQWVYASPEMRSLGLHPLFDAFVLSSTLGFRKPDPRMFSKALSSLRVSADSALYVGDNPERDVVGAHSAGMRCLLYDSGENRESIRPMPDGFFSDYRELPALLRKMEQD